MAHVSLTRSVVVSITVAVTLNRGLGQIYINQQVSAVHENIGKVQKCM
jgi:hypothetical protein